VSQWWDVVGVVLYWSTIRAEKVRRWRWRQGQALAKLLQSYFWCANPASTFISFAFHHDFRSYTDRVRRAGKRWHPSLLSNQPTHQLPKHHGPARPVLLQFSRRADGSDPILGLQPLHGASRFMDGPWPLARSLRRDLRL